MPTTQEDFNALRKALENNKVEDLKKILQNFDLTAINNGGQNCLMICCAYSESPEVVKVILEKIDETGGPVLFKSLLAATNNVGQNCLMLCGRYSKSPEVVKVVLEKIEETGGPDLLKSQLTATNNGGQNCLMICCYNSESPEVVKVILKKIEQTGGPDLLKSLLVATDNKGQNCLMLYCYNSESPEVMKVILKKIEQTGGPDLLKSQLTATDNDGRNCLILCGWSNSPEVMKVLLEKIEETGGPDLLKSLLTATNNAGSTCLMLCGHYSSSPQVMKLFTVVLFHFDLFKIQYPKLADNHKKRLKEKAGIDSSSWVPDAASLAEVKAILQGVDPAAAKKKAEEEAAEKKKAENPSPSPSGPLPHEDPASFHSPPPSRCFKRGVPGKNLETSVDALFSIKDAPEKRPDLKNWIPDSDDASNLLHYLNTALPDLKERPAIKKLIAENELTDDDIKVLHSYKIQNPYPVYLWLNGWLGGDRRDDFVKEHVAPFFVLLYRAMEKLPRVKTVADRAIKVNGIPALKNTFDNYKNACAPKSTLSFWGFSSFSTESDVVNREEFVGKPQEEAIVYSCGELEGVDMEPFAPQGLKSESEILPLCPCVLEVQTSLKIGKKLVVSVKQLNHADFAYVVPK